MADSKIPCRHLVHRKSGRYLSIDKRTQTPRAVLAHQDHSPVILQDWYLVDAAEGWWYLMLPDGGALEIKEDIYEGRKLVKKGPFDGGNEQRWKLEHVEDLDGQTWVRLVHWSRDDRALGIPKSGGGDLELARIGQYHHDSYHQHWRLDVLEIGLDMPAFDTGAWIQAGTAPRPTDQSWTPGSEHSEKYVVGACRVPFHMVHDPRYAGDPVKQFQESPSYNLTRYTYWHSFADFTVRSGMSGRRKVERKQGVQEVGAAGLLSQADVEVGADAQIKLGKTWAASSSARSGLEFTIDWLGAGFPQVRDLPLQMEGKPWSLTLERRLGATVVDTLPKATTDDTAFEVELGLPAERAGEGPMVVNLWQRAQSIELVDHRGKVCAATLIFPESEDMAVTFSEVPETKEEQAARPMFFGGEEEENVVSGGLAKGKDGVFRLAD